MQRAVPFLRSRRYLRGRPVHGTESASFCYSLKSPGTFQLKRCGLLLPSSWEAKDEVVGELSATLPLSDYGRIARQNGSSCDRFSRADESLRISVNESLKSSLEFVVFRSAASHHFPRQMTGRFSRNPSIPSAASSKSILHAITS